MALRSSALMVVWREAFAYADLRVDASEAPIAGLLMRHELRLVATSPTVAPAVRALCLEHLERRPPAEFGELPEDDETLQ